MCVRPWAQEHVARVEQATQEVVAARAQAAAAQAECELSKRQCADLVAAMQVPAMRAWGFVRASQRSPVPVIRSPRRRG